MRRAEDKRAGRAPGERRGERGATLLEFVFTAAVYLMMLVGIVASGHFFWTRNALVEATRRGARYAAMHPSVANDADVRNVVVYGTPAPAQGAVAFVPNLTPDNVTVTPSATFGVAQGSVSVSITNYEYNFVIPGISKVISMPECRSTAAGESAGNIPDNKQ